uniref:Uncharacterized protein n=1 Tax=Rhizophora mucronata TaxID=61149 RepID=A0A2P2M8Q8_RHIMU
MDLMLLFTISSLCVS